MINPVFGKFASLRSPCVIWEVIVSVIWQNGLRRSFVFFLTLLFIFSSIKASAQEEILLILENNRSQETIELTKDQLLAFDQVEVVTKNEFIDGEATFVGPLVRDVLELLEADVEMLRFTAINDYSIDIPVSDFDSYNVIFALSQDGEMFSIRDKGPIWVIYPMSENVELQDRMYNDRLIWQLAKVSAL